MEHLKGLAPAYLHAIQQCTNARRSYLTFDGNRARLGPSLLGDFPNAENTIHLVEDEEENDKIIPGSFHCRLTPSNADLDGLLQRRQVLSSQVAATSTKPCDEFDLALVVFVIDTNVLVADPCFLERFLHLEAKIYIPVIVMEELVALSDHPNPTKSSKAQAALRWLDEFHPDEHKATIKSLFASGRSSCTFNSRYEPDSLACRTNDDLILKLCLILQSQLSQLHDVRAVLISEDVNMRLTARAMRVRAESIDGFMKASITKGSH